MRTKTERDKGMSQLVDLNGRAIPNENERVYAIKDRQYFCLQQPELNLATIYGRYVEYLGEELLSDLSLDEFSNKFNHLLDRVANDLTCSFLLKGVHVPFILPQKDLLGKQPIDSLIQKVSTSFTGSFPKYEFRKLSKIDLDKDLKVSENSRWDILGQEWNHKLIVGIYFPTALSGFAIPDHVSVISRFPRYLVLSGIPEAASSFIGSPNILMKTDGKYPNLLALSAFSNQDKEQSHMFHFFEAYGWNLYFNQRSNIGAVSEYYSGGLSAIDISL